MGFDVIGLHPTGEEGEEFSTNVWTWHPLWRHCRHVAPELVADVKGEYNDGQGLNKQGAEALAGALQLDLDLGITCRKCTAFVTLIGFSYRPPTPAIVRRFIVFLRSCGGFEIW